MQYGKGKVLDSDNIRYFDDNGSVLVRGLRMSFSFASGVRKSFVEDVVFAFNAERKIDNIAFGLGKTAEDDMTISVPSSTTMPSSSPDLS